MGKNITRAQFEALNCELIEQGREGGGAMGMNAMDVYLAPGGQTVIHTWAMGGESFELLDAQVSPLEPTVRCVGRGAGDGCGHEGGNSGDVCPSCGGMLLSNEAAAKAAQLAAYWIAENAPNTQINAAEGVR